MRLTERSVLAGVLAFLAALSAVMLSPVLGTIFFALTVAAVCVPYHRMMVAHGFHRWWASLVMTLLVYLAGLTLVTPFVFIIYINRQTIIDYIARLPNEFVIEFATLTYTVPSADLEAFLQNSIRTGIRVTARVLPELLMKVTLFGFVLFGVLYGWRELSRALLAIIPPQFQENAVGFHRRIMSTLYGIYIIQAVTAVATGLISIPIFWLLGYRSFLILALLAGFLQFLPVVGPSILVGILAFISFGDGNVDRAFLVLALGFPLIGWLPDALIRPRLSRRTAELPATLYFIGFTGGLFSMGPVGLIAGPILVAVVVEAVEQLSDTFRPEEATALDVDLDDA